MSDTGTERFDVWQWYPDEWHECIGRDLTAEAAVDLARAVTLRPAAMAGAIWRVQITDRDDYTVFLWEHPYGVIYPKPAC